MQPRLNNLPQLTPITDGLSRYIRSSWMLCSRSELQLSDKTRIRLFPENEADQLAEITRKRNVFARHSWENSFYLQRIKALSNRTVIEVFRLGDPDDMINEAEQFAIALEKLAVLSTTFSMSRSELQRRLALSEYRRSEFDVTIGRDFNYLRSKSKPERTVQGIAIDERFCRRFERCGFPTLLSFCVTDNDIARRVRRTVDWLFESRLEPGLSAAAVKTSIALESLLIFSESESLSSSLSERAAFILSPSEETRRKVSRLVKNFYDIRSGVVHGNRKKAAMLTARLLDAVDRLILMLCLIIASNSDKWISQETLREWSESQRWGGPSTNVLIPIPAMYIRNTLTMYERDSRST